jgi:integrase
VIEPAPRRHRRQVLTDRQVAGLPRKAKRYFHPDPEMPGYGVRVLPEGPSSYYTICRDAFGKQRWVRIGGTAELSIEQARSRARIVIRRLRDGLEPFEAPKPTPDSVADVAREWVTRYVRKNGLRTADEMERILARYVLPPWHKRPFAEIKRSDVARLLDAIEDKHGAHTADAAFAVLRAISTWYGERDDDYTPIRGLKKRVPKNARMRSRILNDDELRRVWLTAEADDGPFGAFVRLSLLCGQRREKIARMRWIDIAPDGTWTIPTEAREKGNPGTLKLPPLAMAIINAQPHLAGSPFVFTGRHNEAISGFSRRHDAFKARCGVENWSLHDCRRTARSLMAKAGVLSEHAERVLGHARGVIEETYDLHHYRDEMGNALVKLAALIETIVRGEPGANVVPMMRAPTVRP